MKFNRQNRDATLRSTCQAIGSIGMTWIHQAGGWLAGALLVALAPAAAAQQVTFPPLIKVIVPFPAGASTDLYARKISAQLAQRLQTQIIVDNRPGASGMIGTGDVAKGPKDGSMILFASPSLTTVAATARRPSYNLETDLTPVSLVWEGPIVVAVSTKTDIKTPADLLAAARKPGAISYGTSGIATHGHLGWELFNSTAKVEMLHVPYKGSAQAVTDLGAGNIQVMSGSNSSFSSQVQAGRVRLIAVASAAPNPLLPGLPTLASVVPGYTESSFLAVLVAAGTPAAIVQRLNREINDISASKEIRQLAELDGSSPVAMSPQEVARFLHEDVAKYKRVATDRNIVLE